MIESYYIGCYWKARSNTLDDCSKLILETLISLRDTQIESFQSWFELANSREKALQKKVELSYDYLSKAVIKGKNKKFGNLGYSLGFWNGEKEEESIGISFNCGSTSIYTPNNVIISLPYEGEKADKILKYDILRQIADIIIKIWKPEILVVKSQIMSNYVKFDAAFLEIGWITYFSKEYQKEKIISSPRFDETFEDIGDFLIVTKERFSSENLEHIKKLQSYVDQFKFKKLEEAV